MALKTFLDSGVLLAAWRGTPFLQRQALSIMADEEREFFTADTVRLELLPKPTFEKRRVEVEFYNEHFNSTAGIEPFSQLLGEAAFNLARNYGLSAGDALNLAAAIRQKAEEFITTESPGRPMFRVREIRVISLLASSFD